METGSHSQYHLQVIYNQQLIQHVFRLWDQIGAPGGMMHIPYIHVFHNEFEKTPIYMTKGSNPLYAYTQKNDSSPS